ncbi:MFS domain-containing protein [Meloidogyne graminicola]|uniref:MFS domain-containing protein n=1 Tax=Meloidogyne graminicola TaxID=189291 RepID=A0A8S9ZXF5_9BILA|nr:MFS domain-containing protein [Meloidogyne graminicola]
MSINNNLNENNNNQQMASRTRFLLLLLVVLCLMINWANILTFNFTVICMKPSEDIVNNNITLNINNNSNDETWLTKEFTSYEKSQSMAMVAIGALITNIPIVTLINWYGPRYLFTAVGFFGAIATALIPYSMKMGWNWFLIARSLQGMAFAGDMATFGHFVTYWTYHKQYAFFTATLCVYVQLAPIFTNPVSGILCESSWRWPGVYYFHAFISIILFSCFYLFYRNDPNKHPFVNEHEKNKIARGRDSSDSEAQKYVPYLEIIRSPVAWAVFIGGIGNFTGINLLYQFTPIYLYKVQGFHVVKTGFMAALPPLGQACMKELAGLINDRIPNRLMNENIKTKVFNSIAFCSMAFILVIASFVPSGHGNLALFLLTAAAFSLGFNIGGFYKSGSMIAGPYSPFVMGQISTAMTLTMLMVPLIVNPLTPNNTQQEWALAFYAIGAIMVLCNIFYCFFASAELQPWATVQYFRERMQIKGNKIYNKEQINKSVKPSTVPVIAA